MNKLELLIASAMLLTACHSKQEGTNGKAEAANLKVKNMDIVEIKKQLIVQSGMDTTDYPGKKVHYLNEKDIDLSLNIIEEGLAEAGYKKPNMAEYSKRIQEIYNCENDDKLWKGIDLIPNLTAKSWLSGSDFIKYYTDNAETERSDYHLIASQDYNFIFDIHLLRNLIQIRDDNTYKITLPRYLISRNTYFFNGNQTAKDELLRDDKQFLRSLVAVFGYDKDDDFNAVALEPYHTGTEEDEGIANIVFNNLQGPADIVVRKGILKYIGDHTSQNDNKMYMGLHNFVFDINDPESFNDLTFTNKCKMLAYAGALGEKLRSKYFDKNPNIWATNSLLTNFKLHFPKFIDEIKKQNYFNEPDIKAAVAVAEQAAVVASLHADPE